MEKKVNKLIEVKKEQQLLVKDKLALDERIKGFKNKIGVGRIQQIEQIGEKEHSDVDTEEEEMDGYYKTFYKH